MSAYWANFIRTGDPNGTDSEGAALPVWPESRENFGWMEFTNEGPVGHDGLSELDRLAKAFIERSGALPKL